MKKTLILFLMIIFSVSLSSCRDWKPYDLEECESGYFKYHIYDEDGSDQTYVYLVGLTELGKQQKELIIPEYIDGLRVDGLGYERPVGGKFPLFGGMQAGDEEVPFVGSDNLEKLYFPFKFSVGEENFYSSVCVKSSNTFLIYWCEILNSTFSIKDSIVSYQLYQYGIKLNSYLPNYLANVSYMYNYDNCPNDGYYWVDSYDNDLISFIPPNPEREGYMFDGWYKEEECINKWDFNTDKTGEELIIEEKDQYTEYPGIYLYAKWIVG